MDKVNQLMKREISQILQREMEDPDFTYVTVLSAKVTPDLHHARVNFSVLGDEKRLKKIQQGLDRTRGYIRRLIGQRISIRYVPEIEFMYDPSLEYSARVEATLMEIRREEEARSSRKDGEPSDAGGEA